MCGAPVQDFQPSVAAPVGSRSRPHRMWWRWLLAVVLSFVVIPMVITISIGIHDTKTADEESKRRIDEKQKIDATPEGKRAEKKRNEDELKASAQRLKRIFYAESCEDSFLDHGFDVRCVVDEDKRELIVAGPPVNRVFAHQFFMAHNAVKVLKAAGFTSVYFSNDKSGFSGDYFSQEFDLTR